MHNNTRQINIGPGGQPNRPARPTRTLTLQTQRNHHCWFPRIISQQRSTVSTGSYLTATLLLHNRPWCGLRSRLGVVRNLSSGSVSTRLVNLALFLALLSRLHRHYVLFGSLPVAAAACSFPAAAADWGHAAVACSFPVVACVLAAAARSFPAAAACGHAVATCSFHAAACEHAATACSSPSVARVHAAAAAGLCLPPLRRWWRLLPLLPAMTAGSTSSALKTLGAACARDRGLLRRCPPPPPSGNAWCSLRWWGCSSPPLSPPSPGLARGWRGGRADCWTWAALLRHSRRCPRAWPGGGGVGGGLLDLGCSSPPLSSLSPGLARGWRGGGRTAGLGLLFSATLTAFPGPGPGEAVGERTAGFGLLFSATLVAVPGPGPGMAAGGGQTAGLGLLFPAALVAVPGPGPRVARGGAVYWT